MKITEKDIQDLSKVEIVQVMEWCKKYLRKSSGVLEQFFQGNYEVTTEKNEGIPINEVYQKYIEWCIIKSLVPIEEKYFSKVIVDVLKNLGCEIKKADGEYFRVITNLKNSTSIDKNILESNETST